MFKFLKASTFLFITALAVTAAQAGPITYQINDYAALEDGYTIAGSITTDGTIGALSSSNITAWTWTLSQGSTTYGTLNSTDAGAEQVVSGVVTASATEITMSTPLSGRNFLSFYSSIINDVNGVGLNWTRRPTIDSFNGYYVNGGFFVRSNNPPRLALPSVDTWVIATAASDAAAVPEPATIVLAGLGALVLGLSRKNRRIA